MGIVGNGLPDRARRTVPGVIAGERCQHRSEIRGLDKIKQWVKILFLLATQDQVVAFIEKRDEVQPVLMCGSLKPKRNIHFVM